MLGHASRGARPEPHTEVTNQPLSEAPRRFAGGSGGRCWLWVPLALGPSAPATAGRRGRLHSAHCNLHRRVCGALRKSTFRCSCCNDQEPSAATEERAAILGRIFCCWWLGECQAR